LSRDEHEVDAYIADPLCGFELQAHSLATMAQVVADTLRIETLRAAAERELPILIISGELDPIGGPNQSLARALAQRYLEAGFTDISHRIYPAGRHEMFNEINRHQVMQDLAQWLDNRIVRVGK
jgi:alpha-beta hydrolase superfamily lysophospholipase